jgi:chorismate mutase
VTWNLNDGRSIASILRSVVSSLASVFMVAIVLRNHGWRFVCANVEQLSSNARNCQPGILLNCKD